MTRKRKPEQAEEEGHPPEADNYGQLTEIESEVWSKNSVEIRNEHEQTYKQLRGPSYEEDMMFSSDDAGYDEMAVIEEALMALRCSIDRRERTAKKLEPTTDETELARRERVDKLRLRDIFEYLEGLTLWITDKNWWVMVDDGDRFDGVVKLIGAAWHTVATLLQSNGRLNAECTRIITLYAKNNNKHRLIYA